MSASFTLNKSGLDELVARFESSTLRDQLMNLANDKGVVAIIAQAIADNFAQEGPGWQALKAKTIRNSVSKEMKKQLQNLTDAQLLRHEINSRSKGNDEMFRAILQKSGLLKKSVTTVGGNHNIYKVEGTNLVWGTDLIYAGVHNRGNPAKHIPKREFLVVRKNWMDQLNEYLLEQIKKIVESQIPGVVS